MNFFQRMTTTIRDENENEDILQENTKLPTRNFIIVAILWLIWIFWNSGVAAVIFFLIVYIFIGYFIIFMGRKIIIDIGVRGIIVEKRTIINKKLEWKITKKINFPDTKAINVIGQYDSNTGDNYYQTELIIVDNVEKILSILWGANSESAKNSAIKICKIIGINGYYIDEKKKSTPLIETT